MNFTYTSLQELQRYNQQLCESVPVIEIPYDYDDCSEDIFQQFEEKLKSLRNFTQLKSEIFQILKEIGNAFSFIQMLSELMELKDQNMHELYSFIETTSLHERMSSSDADNAHLSSHVSSIVRQAVDNDNIDCILHYFVVNVMSYVEALGLKDEWKDTFGELKTKQTTS